MPNPRSQRHSGKGCIKTISCISPENGKVEDGTERPLWLPPDKKATPKAETSLDFEVAFGDGKTFHIPDEIADVERWKAFASGEHTARLKGNQLVITKRET